jgi:alpha-beta hydrolase superfamily lysophospholipase
MTQGLANTLVEKVKGAGDLNIAVRSWRPEGKARGVVAIVPGFNSHGGYYAWVAQQFTASGLAVYAVDLRGRGDSDGERSTSRSLRITSATSRP